MRKKWIVLACGLAVFAVSSVIRTHLAGLRTTFADQGNCLDKGGECRPPRGLRTCNTQDGVGGTCMYAGLTRSCTCVNPTPRPSPGNSGCSVGFFFPSPQVEPGSSLTGFLDVSCPFAPPNGSADLYVGVLPPGGPFLFLGSDGNAFGSRFQAAPAPVHIFMTPGTRTSRVTLPVFRVPMNIPQGRYTFFAGLGEPTTDVSELIASPFSLLSPITSSDVIIQFFPN